MKAVWRPWNRFTWGKRQNKIEAWTWVEGPGCQWKDCPQSHLGRKITNICALLQCLRRPPTPCFMWSLPQHCQIDIFHSLCIYCLHSRDEDVVVLRRPWLMWLVKMVSWARGQHLTSHGCSVPTTPCRLYLRWISESLCFVALLHSMLQVALCLILFVIVAKEPFTAEFWVLYI